MFGHRQPPRRGDGELVRATLTTCTTCDATRVPSASRSIARTAARAQGCFQAHPRTLVAPDDGPRLTEPTTSGVPFLRRAGSRRRSGRPARVASAEVGLRRPVRGIGRRPRAGYQHLLLTSPRTVGGCSGRISANHVDDPSAPRRASRRSDPDPARGWWQVTRRAVKEAKADNVPILGAGVAFFAFLAIVPALIAALTLYGLVADPQTSPSRCSRSPRSLPETSQPLVADQLNAVVSSSDGALGIGLVVSVLAALWSAVERHR